jgi:DNA methyltransferase 1-associated protein 1
MSSSRDVADILGDAKGAVQHQLNPPRQKLSSSVRSLSSDSFKDHKQKPVGKGLSREIFALTGGAQPAASPQKTQSPFSFFRDKRKGVNKHVQWEWKAFTNCARTDGLELKHWQKKGLEWDEYIFARFNKKLQFLKYSDEEYEEHLRSSNWPKSESDKLMSLIQQFGMNFFLVHDRWCGTDRRCCQPQDTSPHFECRRFPPSNSCSPI